MPSRPIYETVVECDEFTKAASTAFDYKFEGKSSFEGWNRPDIPEDFSIGLILGPSGSGKTLLLKEFGQEENPEWNPAKAVVSHFLSPEDALDRRSVWAMFAKHHYLTEKIAGGCRSYLATAIFDANTFNASDEAIVGFASTIPFPHGYIHNAYREHRTVVLPDFQGLGLGPKISDAVAQIHKVEGKRYFSRTAHPRFGAYRDRSPLWKRTSNNKKVSRKTAYTETSHLQKWKIDSVRECFSHEYIGERNA
jgi:GNAT superfamily N-acetyltransferase